MTDDRKPRINTKRKGSRNELKVKHLLEKAGYIGTKSAASLGEFDLVMFRPGSLRLIQVKSNRMASPAERDAIEQCCVKTGDTLTVSKEIWVIKDRQREPIIKIIK